MRRRINSALALAALAGLAGCATQQPRRGEAPFQFRDWTPPPGSATASTSSPTSTPTPTPTPTQTPARPAGPISSFLARTTGGSTWSAFPTRSSTSTSSGPISTFLARATGKAPASDWPPQPDTPRPAPTPASQPNANTNTNTSLSAKDEIPPTAVRPRYRPGSWLFRKLAKPESPPPTTRTDPNGSLARYFPTQGRSPADTARVARASRPTGGDRAPALSGASIEMTRNTIEPAEVEAPLLAEGIALRAYPKPPSPSLPPREAVARRDDPEPDGRLTSHETETPSPRPRHDLIDGLSDRLDAQPPAASNRPDPDDAPTDPAGRPTSAIVEVPAPASDRPAGALVASPEPEAKPGETGAPVVETDLISRLLAPPAWTPSALPAPAATAASEPTPPEPVRPTTPAPRPRHRVVRAEAFDLPEPEFPATYHTESLRQVAREAPRPARSRMVEVDPAPHKPLLPRLSRLLWGPGEKDQPSRRAIP